MTAELEQTMQAASDVPKDNGSINSFREAMERNGVELNPDGGIPMIPKEPAAKEPAKEPAPAKEPEAKAPERKKPEVVDGMSFPEDLATGGPSAPEAPKEDPDAIFDEAPKGPVKHEHFERVQKAAKERVAAIKAEMEQLRAEKAKPSDALPEEHVKLVEKLRAEVEEYRERIGRDAFEKSDDFRSKFTSKEESLRNLLNEAGDAAGLEKDLTASLLHLPLKRRNALLNEAEIGPSERGRIDNLLVRYDELQADKTAELGKWKETATARQQQQQAQALAQQEAERKQSQANYEEVFAKFMENPGLKRDTPEWQETTKKNNDLSSRLYTGQLNEKAVALASLKAAWFDTIVQHGNEGWKLANERANEIARLKGNGPALNGHPVNNGAEPASTKGMSEEQITKNTWRETMNRHGVRTN